MRFEGRECVYRNYYAGYLTSWGRFYIGWNSERVVSLSNIRPIHTLVDDISGLGILAAEQLNEYLAGRRRCFTLPWVLQGTAFQVACWRALLRIPYGTTCSYQHLAGLVGKSKAARAVGQAIHTNPLMIIIPCHRVIASDGALAGYAGGTTLKRKLLNMESKHRKSHLDDGAASRK